MSTANKKSPADRQNRQGSDRGDDARRQTHDNTGPAGRNAQLTYPPVPGCECGACGDSDNEPRPHNLASIGKHRHVTEDVFEFVRSTRRFTKDELQNGVQRRWATANGYVPSLRALRSRGLIDYHFDRQAGIYVVTRVSGEVAS